MGDLNAFLNPAYTEKRVSFVVGDRFLNADGEPEKLIMKALSQEELLMIGKRSTHTVDVGGAKVERMDDNEYLNRCIIASMVFPDLQNRELCLKYKTEDPVHLPMRLFLPDEYKKIASVFANLCGLDDYKDISTIGEVTKN